MDPALFGTALGVVGLGTLIFAALKFRPEQTGMLVDQVSKMAEGMDTINAELRRQRDEAIDERDRVRAENRELQGKLDTMTTDLADARSEIAASRSEIAALSAQVTQLQETIAQLQKTVNGDSP